MEVVLWAERAEAELRATQTVRKRDRSTIEQLTPQELQIAELVPESLTSKETTAQQVLSPCAVE